MGGGGKGTTALGGVPLERKIAKTRLKVLKVEILLLGMTLFLSMAEASSPLGNGKEGLTKGLGSRDVLGTYRMGDGIRDGLSCPDQGERGRGVGPWMAYMGQPFFVAMVAARRGCRGQSPPPR